MNQRCKLRDGIPGFRRLTLGSAGDASILRCLLAKRKRKDLDAGIEEFNFKSYVFDRSLLPDELIHPRLSNLARAIGAGIGSMIIAGRCAIQLYLEANGRPVLRRTQNHMEVAAVEPEHDRTGCRLKHGALRADVPRSAQSQLINEGLAGEL